jgi:thiol peroxidase
VKFNEGDLMRIAMVLTATLLAGCVTTGGAPSFPVSQESVAPGTTVKRGGTPMKLASGKIELDQPMPAVALTDTNWASYTFKGDGKVRLVSFVPSVDTKVCEVQTHELGEGTNLNPKVERVTISRDLPAAQKRFAEEAKLQNITYLSDFKAGAFGKASGLLIEDSGLLARGVAVIDGQGKVRHLQIVPELGVLPDMAKAISVANELAK